MESGSWKRRGCWVREAWGVVDEELECTKQNEFIYTKNIV
jgi:hypothetical protein